MREGSYGVKDGATMSDRQHKQESELYRIWLKVDDGDWDIYHLSPSLFAESSGAYREFRIRPGRIRVNDDIACLA